MRDEFYGSIQPVENFEQLADSTSYVPLPEGHGEHGVGPHRPCENRHDDEEAASEDRGKRCAGCVDERLHDLWVKAKIARTPISSYMLSSDSLGWDQGCGQHDGRLFHHRVYLTVTLR